MSLPRPGRPAAALAVVAVASLPLWPRAATANSVATDGAGRIQVFVELQEPPAVRSWQDSLRRGGGDGPQALAAAASAVQENLRALQAEQEAVAAALVREADAREVFRVQRVLNGLAVFVDRSRLDILRAIPGVRSVRPMSLHFPLNSTSVPFLGMPEVWSAAGLDLTGEGVSIGVLDTGIDYLHAGFGGRGLDTDYQANDRTSLDGFFPTAKVVGGFDFAGDDYNGNNTPRPDPDPMDCSGHGSHVAGTAAGFGVSADGTTYRGPYGPGADLESLRIGPGVAPEAELYALRVFGCSGGTGLVVQAIEWAVDPDGDGDLSDHLDILNLSLGSDFGRGNDPSAVAADNAALAGVVVVAAAGNSGDTFFISSSPAAADRAISVAASVDDGLTMVAVEVSLPPDLSGVYPGAGAAFGAGLEDGVSGDLAVMEDGVSGEVGVDGKLQTTTDGCEPPNNAVSGKIALVDRGACFFVTKARNAQEAGAAALIVVNDEGDELIVMGDDGTGGDIVIPAVLIGRSDGELFKSRLAQGARIRAALGVRAAAELADTLVSFSSRGPRVASPGMVLKPELAAPGLTITSVQSGVSGSDSRSVTFSPGNRSLDLSGTSMATPHVAGVMALLRQLHPDWRVEELKALAMNTALNGLFVGSRGGPARFGPSRAGAGRIDPVRAAASGVVAFSGDNPGSVSLTFDAEVLEATRLTGRLQVANKGDADATYDVDFRGLVDAPGVEVELPAGDRLTVPAGEEAEVEVELRADPALMRRARHGAVQATQSVGQGVGHAPRHFLTEEAGFVTFSQGGAVELRVPVYAVLRPAAFMRGDEVVATGGAATGSGVIALTGQDLDTTGGLGLPSPADVVSLVTPLELQLSSPEDPELQALLPAADLQHVGVASDFGATGGVGASTLIFGISTHGGWSTLNEVELDVVIDVDLDGFDDFVLHNGSGQGPTDGFYSFLYDMSTRERTAQFPVNLADAASVDTAVFNSDVVVLAVHAGAPAGPGSGLGLDGAQRRIRYRVETCPGILPLCGVPGGAAGGALDVTASAVYDVAAPGLDFASSPQTFLLPDVEGATIPVSWNLGHLAANGSLGGLLLHHHNLSGNRAQAVGVDIDGTTAACADSDIGLCLEERFLVTVDWRDFEGEAGPGFVVPFRSQGAGLFWFFDPSNWELLVKVLDGCSVNDHYWIFAAAVTNVEYTLRVRDTQSGEVWESSNPLGQSSPAVTDTQAFATCP